MNRPASRLPMLLRLHRASRGGRRVPLSPAYHNEPDTNGCVERFLGIVKEQVLWRERFETFEDLAPLCAPSAAPSTSAGCSNATTTARPPNRASSRSVRPP